MSDIFGGDGFPHLDPSPDEDAWEAFIEFAWDRIGGQDANGIDNPLVAKIEAALGTMLPFEVGLLLVMGVPDGDEWFRWSDDPATDLEQFTTTLRARLIDDVATGTAWSSTWGARPQGEAERAAVAGQAFDDAPALLPLHSSFAVPVTVAHDEASSDANPVLAVDGATVRVAGTDLAEWLHKQFDVPLPMWPDTPARSFPFWSDLT